MAGLEPAATERRIAELEDSLATVQAQVAISFGCQMPSPTLQKLDCLTKACRTCSERA